MPTELIGRAIEDIVEAYALLTGHGRITASRPSSDVDHKDFIIDERGGYRSVYAQVKGVTQVNALGQIRIQVVFREGEVLSSPRFLYLFVLLDSKTVSVRRMYLIPSPDFNRLAPRAKARPGYVVLPFVDGRASGRSKWDRFLIQPEKLGVKLFAAIEAAKDSPAISRPIRASLVMQASRTTRAKSPHRTKRRILPERNGPLKLTKAA
jgi:hypothetical protein